MRLNHRQFFLRNLHFVTFIIQCWSKTTVYLICLPDFLHEWRHIRNHLNQIHHQIDIPWIGYAKWIGLDQTANETLPFYTQLSLAMRLEEGDCTLVCFGHTVGCNLRPGFFRTVYTSESLSPLTIGPCLGQPRLT